MRSGEHWDGYPPDDPPLCNHMGDCECEFSEEDEMDEQDQRENDDYIRREANSE